MKCMWRCELCSSGSEDRTDGKSLYCQTAGLIDSQRTKLSHTAYPFVYNKVHYTEYSKCTSAGTLHWQTAHLNSDVVSPRSQSAQTSDSCALSQALPQSAAALSCIHRHMHIYLTDSYDKVPEIVHIIQFDGNRRNLLDCWFFLKSCLLHAFINFFIYRIPDFFETCLFFLGQTKKQHLTLQCH